MRVKTLKKGAAILTCFALIIMSAIPSLGVKAMEDITKQSSEIQEIAAKEDGTITEDEIGEVADEAATEKIKDVVVEDETDQEAKQDETSYADGEVDKKLEETEPVKYTVTVVVEGNGIMESGNDDSIVILKEAGKIVYEYEAGSTAVLKPVSKEGNHLDDVEIMNDAGVEVIPEIIGDEYHLGISENLNVKAIFRENDILVTAEKRSAEEESGKSDEESDVLDSELEENDGTTEPDKLEGTANLDTPIPEDAMILVTNQNSQTLKVEAPMASVLSRSLEARAGGIVYYGDVSYHGYKAGVFTVNGQQAFCLQHEKWFPNTGDGYIQQIYENNQIRQILYSGWGGANQWPGFESREHGIVLTSLALSVIYYGSVYSDYIYEQGRLNDFMAYCFGTTIPVTTLKFSTSYLESYLSADKSCQMTDDITLTGDSKNSITVPLPNGVTLHNKTKGTTGTGNVTVYGGDTFYLTAPLTLNETWKSGHMVGCMGRFQAIVTLPTTNTQDLGQGQWIADPEKYVELSVKWLAMGKIHIQKVDSETNKSEPQGAATLAGAVYGIYKKSDMSLATTVTINKNGEATSELLVFDTYIVKEISPAEGYNMDETEYEVTLPATGDNPVLADVESQEDIIRGDLEIAKFGAHISETSDIKNPLEGVEFTITSETTGESWSIVTDKDGCANTKQLEISDRGNLVFDTYTVSETKTTKGYQSIDDFKVTISEEGTTLRYIAENTEVFAPIQVVKIDSSTGKVIPLAGATFQILDKDKNPMELVISQYPTVQKATTFKTDENGSFVFPQMFDYGTYYLKEIQAPEGYLLNDELIEITIDEMKDWDSPVVVEFPDDSEMGQITLLKTDEETDAAIAGAEFTVTAAEIIITPEGTVRAEKGDVVDTIVTGEDGTGTSRELFLGKYTVQETKAGAGYICDSDKTFEIELTYADQNTPIVVDELGTITNKPTTFKLTKFKKGTDETLEGVTFAIWNKEDESTKQEYKTEADGTITVKYLSEGTYCVQETATLPGYILSDEIFEFTVDENGYIDGQEVGELNIENDYTRLIGTTARDKDTGKNQAIAKEDTTVIDTVAFEKLIIGQEYTVKGTAMIQKTGEPLLVNGKAVTEETTFIAEIENETVDVIFKFDSSELRGKSIVIFEEVYTEGMKIATHADINDKGQTIEFPEGEIHTTAKDKDSNSQIARPSEKTTILDTVDYTDLIPGIEHLLKGVAMIQETGEPLLINGEMVTAEKVFTPEKADGSVVMEFTFDSSALAGKSVVIFEAVYVDEIEVAVHADINDKGQTVSFKEGKIITTTPNGHIGGVKTGDTANMVMYLVFAIAAFTTVTGISVYRYQRRRGESEKKE